MATWCLTKLAEERLLDALRKDGDPQKMVDRGSEGRRKFFANAVGEENATQINALYESKMLLKNQRRGLESFVKGLGGAKEVRTDFLAKVERLDKALSKKELNQFLEDYTAKRLGASVTEAEANDLISISRKINELASKFDPIKGEWTSKEAAKEYGKLQAGFEDYTDQLKFKNLGIRKSLGNRATQFKHEFPSNPPKAIAKGIIDTANGFASATVQLVATLDDSFFGRQGILNLLSGHPILWSKAFAHSFVDLFKAFGGRQTTFALRSELYSDPLYMSGELKRAGILDLAEEQYPAHFLTKIPIIGTRGIRGFEEAFVNGSLRMRVGLYKIMRQAKVNKNIALDDAEIKGMGTLVNSLSARGQLPSQFQSPIVRLLLWAPKMLKADLDVLTAHTFSNIPRSDRKVALRNLATIVAITVLVEGINGAVNGKDKVELDPRSSDFLQFDRKFGFLRGMPQIITLMARMITGEYKNSKGEIVPYQGKIGALSRLDALISFLRGKAPPATGGLWDVLDEQDFYGNKPTFTSLILQRGVPISLQNLNKFRKDPTVDKAMGVVGDFFGLNANLNPDPNVKSQIIPEGKKQKQSDVIGFIKTYAEAMQTDPETAFNRAFTGQKIIKTENGAIIVERMSLHDSQALKKKYGKNTKQVKLDHTVPLELGGDNNENNLKLVSTGDWKSYTKVENALGRALKNKKVSKDEAQRLIKKFKAISDSKERKAYGEKIMNQYK
jgi:hypothetical protein